MLVRLAFGVYREALHALVSLCPVPVIAFIVRTQPIAFRWINSSWGRPRAPLDAFAIGAASPSERCHVLSVPVPVSLSLSVSVS